MSPKTWLKIRKSHNHLGQIKTKGDYMKMLWSWLMPFLFLVLGTQAWSMNCINPRTLYQCSKYYKINENINPNKKDSGGYTPLMHAIKDKSLEDIFLLCTHPQINVDDYFKENTMESALLEQANRDNKDIIKAFWWGLRFSAEQKAAEKKLAEEMQDLAEAKKRNRE